MKKAVICAAIVAIFNVSEGTAMDSALIRVGENKIATVGENVGTMAIRSRETTNTTVLKDENRYNDFFEINGEKVVLSFVKGRSKGEQFIIKNTFAKEYPYEKIFRGLEEADENHSYAIYEIFADTAEVGRLRLTDGYADEDNPLEHQKTESNIVNNDDELVTTKDVETFVMLDGKKQIIRAEKGVKFPYRVLRTEKDKKYKSAPDGGDNVKIYVRWNGEEVRRAWDGLVLVEKPAKEPPVAGLGSNIFPTTPHSK